MAPVPQNIRGIFEPPLPNAVDDRHQIVDDQLAWQRESFERRRKRHFEVRNLRSDMLRVYREQPVGVHVLRQLVDDMLSDREQVNVLGWRVVIADFHFFDRIYVIVLTKSDDDGVVRDQFPLDAPEYAIGESVVRQLFPQAVLADDDDVRYQKFLRVERLFCELVDKFRCAQ